MAYFRFSTVSIRPLTGAHLPGREALEALLASPMFGRHAPSRLMAAFPLMMEATAPAGQVVLPEGRPADALYIIVDGQAELYRTLNSSTRCEVARLGPGDTFGETAALGGGPSPLGVRAATDLRLLIVRPERVRRLPWTLPSLPAQMAGVMADRMSRLAARLAAHLGDGRVGRLDVLGPKDLVQALCLGRLTGTLMATRQGIRIEMYFADGQVLRSVNGACFGEEQHRRTQAEGQARLQQEMRVRHTRLALLWTDLLPAREGYYQEQADPAATRDRIAGVLNKINEEIESDGASAQGLFLRGLAHQILGDLAPAVRDLRAAVALEPEFGPAWGVLALVLADLSQQCQWQVGGVRINIAPPRLMDQMAEALDRGMTAGPDEIKRALPGFA